MIIVHDAAVGADGHVDAGLLKVFVPGLRDFDDRRRLAAADALRLSRDADGAAADADLYEVCAGFRQEAESVRIHHVACADLDVVAVVVADPLDGVGLPGGEAFGGVDAQDVHAGVDQSGYASGEVSGVDTCADDVSLMFVQQLVGVGFVGIVVLAEDEGLHAAGFVQHGQGVEPVIPQHVVGFAQGDAVSGVDELFQRGHEFLHLGVQAHAAYAVVAAGDQTNDLTLARAVFRNGCSGVAGALL